MGWMFGLSFLMAYLSIMALYASWHSLVLGWSLLCRRRIDGDALEKGVSPAEMSPSETQSFAILCPVCDDFDPASIRSCLALNYEGYHIYILDDSSNAAAKAEIDRLALEVPDQITVIRRTEHRAAKAGNINHGLAQLPETFKWGIVMDSDNLIEPDALTYINGLVAQYPDKFFIQFAHSARFDSMGEFEEDFCPLTEIHWGYYQDYRNLFGMPFFYGHGAAINLDILRELGGIPETKSEDISLTIRGTRAGYQGLFCNTMLFAEGLPGEYFQFRRRFLRYVSFDLSNFISCCLPAFLSRELSLVQKVDLMVRQARLPLIALSVPALLVGAFVLTSVPVQVFCQQYWYVPITLAILSLIPLIPLVPLSQRYRGNGLIRLAKFLTLSMSLIVESTVVVFDWFYGNEIGFTPTNSSKVTVTKGLTRQNLLVIALTMGLIWASVLTTNPFILAVVSASVFGLIAQECPWRSLEVTLSTGLVIVPFLAGVGLAVTTGNIALLLTIPLMAIPLSIYI